MRYLPKLLSITLLFLWRTPAIAQNGACPATGIAAGVVQASNGSGACANTDITSSSGKFYAGDFLGDIIFTYPNNWFLRFANGGAGYFQTGLLNPSSCQSGSYCQNDTNIIAQADPSNSYWSSNIILGSVNNGHTVGAFTIGTEGNETSSGSVELSRLYFWDFNTGNCSTGVANGGCTIAFTDSNGPGYWIWQYKVLDTGDHTFDGNVFQVGSGQMRVGTGGLADQSGNAFLTGNEGLTSVVGKSPTLRVGGSTLYGCIELGNSDGTPGVTYITAKNGVLTVSISKPASCQ
jgi:hypothetical protein